MRQAIAVMGNDYHLGQSNGDLVKDIFRQHIAAARSRSTNCILIGGDMFTNRSGQPLTTLTDFLEMIQMMEDEKMTLEIIPGNHDKTDGNDERSYLDVYRSPRLHIHRVGECRIIGGCIVAFIPYFGEQRWLEEYRRVEEIRDGMYQEGDVESDAPCFLITHMGVDGARNNDGTLVSSPISVGLLDDWTQVLIGHYHDAHTVGGSVRFTGSVYQNNFGENAADKGFTVLYDDGTTEHMQSEFPTYFKVEIDVNDTEALREVTEAVAPVKEAGDYLRVVFTGAKADMKKIPQAELTAMGVDVKFKPDESTEAMETAEAEDVLSYDRSSIMKDFMKYCSVSEIRGAELKYGLELIKML